jgi:hypothetical protein
MESKVLSVAFTTYFEVGNDEPVAKNAATGKIKNKKVFNRLIL